MKYQNYECRVDDCGKVFDSLLGIKTHLRRTHGLNDPKEAKDYAETKKKPPKKSNNSSNWRSWQKYPDGSRKYRLIDNKWVKQPPGEYFKEKDKAQPSNQSDLSGTNYQCRMKLDNGRYCNKVISSRPGISAHLVHGHKVGQVDDTMYRMTSEPAEPKARASKRPYRKRQTPQTNIAAQFGRPMMDNGFILLPVTLRIPFNLGIPEIIQGQDQEI
jgi:hypothetical protein